MGNTSSTSVGNKTGKMIQWNAEKHFGFIKPDEEGEDLFVHVSALVDGDGIPQGSRVTFNKEFNAVKNKWLALNVRIDTSAKKTVKGDKGDKGSSNRESAGAPSSKARERDRDRDRGRDKKDDDRGSKKDDDRDRGRGKSGDRDRDRNRRRKSKS